MDPILNERKVRLCKLDHIWWQTATTICLLGNEHHKTKVRKAKKQLDRCHTHACTHTHTHKFW